MICRRVGLSASLLSASWFVGELGCRRVRLSASWCVGELVCRRVVQLPHTLDTAPKPNPKPYTIIIAVFQAVLRQILMYIGAVVPLCAVSCFIWTDYSHRKWVALKRAGTPGQAWRADRYIPLGPGERSTAMVHLMQLCNKPGRRAAHNAACARVD